ncbi:MAG: cyclic nucleotide-binding domain-containing protein [Polyangia bacterium]|jgi:CRP-like cAMP-binding protein|nr:cyclic nucleotide-binding domain-containing protein [Polyangia bacterium]
MIQQKIEALVQRYLREEFGRLLQYRGLAPTRRAAGILWRADVVCPTPEGEIPVGRIGVDESGRFVEKVVVGDLLKALREFVHVEEGQSIVEEAPPNPLADAFAELAAEEQGDELLGDDFGFLIGETYDELRGQVDSALALGTPTGLRQALQLLPRLLSYPDTRGDTLAEMASLEFQAGDREMALNYLEAATREYADRSNLEGLERLAALTLSILGEAGYATSLSRQLLAQLKAQLAPVSDLFSTGYFHPLDEEGRGVLRGAVRELTLAPGENLMREGEEARHVYVISSGQFSVLLEAEDGSSRPIRCLFPGELVGEAAVMPGGSPFRTATVRADRVSTVWELDGPTLLGLIERSPTLAEAIRTAREMRRVHSFFSMHETMGQLDVRVRDELMACITRIARHPAGEVLVKEEELPPLAVLVAAGRVEHIVQGKVTRVYGPDTFAALRDTIMELTSEGRYVVAEDSTLVEFDPVRLRALCQGASAAVVAVMERLE